MARVNLFDEMANDLAKCCFDLVSTSCNGVPCITCLTTMLINQGYCKIPDGAVLIDKVELEALRNDLINAECNLNHVTLQLEEESKRMAREIFRRVCNIEYSIYDDAYGYANALVCEFEKIFKEYRIEV